MPTRALVPKLMELSPGRVSGEFWSFTCGLLLLVCLSQVVIPLPWTPVPLTGQTLGCTLIALSWGGRRATLVFLVYLLLGTVGVPVFAEGKSGLFGATSGYLLGMLATSWLVGALADRGWASSFAKALGASLIGMIIVYIFGLFVLSYYVPTQYLLMAGLWPFIPGDFLKCLVASYVAYRAQDVLEEKNLH